MSSSRKATAILARLQWMRGVRAGVAVAGALWVSHALGWPMGWAALGGFEAILVDNGGPYRSRLATMATLMVGGAVACVVGASAGHTLLTGILVTAAFCFLTTYARVASEWIASTSVIILVLYFAGFDGSDHTLPYALRSALEFVLGGAWAAALSLVLWPVDPFRPARLAVAECYRLLAEFTRRMADGVHEPEHAEVLQREMRRQLELARRALEATAARVVARTVRARNLTVLLETADMLFATTLRWTELANGLKDPDSLQALSEAAAWLSGAGRAIFAGLQQRPLDSAASYLPEGSHSMEFIRGRPLPRRELSPYSGQPLISAAGSALAHLAADERDAVQNVQIAFESVRAIWSGLEMKRGAAAERWMMLTREPSVSDIETVRREDVLESRSAGWWSNCVTNWTFDSLMMRHALRMGVVGGVDVVLLQLLHVRHGSWLAMTSIIVLQPYGSGTLRRGFERVGGTIAGGVLAAVLAAGVQSEAGIIFAITLTSVLTLALYTVNYAWYCFFLTPTFVLMSMPHLRDWQFAGVRMGNTVLGALVAAMAMRLLWPEKQHIELGRLLGRGAEASAAYLQAMTEAWRRRDAANPEIDRRILAPARRLCGLTINDAEESLDRMLLEPDFGGRNKNDPSPTPDAKTEALTFVTYLRRLMRTATALTAVQPPNEQTVQCIEALTMRLKQAADTLVTGISAEGIATPATETKTSEQITQGLVGSPEAESIQEQQVRRLERQIGVLERAATALASKPD